MADPEFESQLTTLYQQCTILADADRFAAQLERRITRRYLLRCLTLAALGTLGALLSLWQAVETGLYAAIQRIALQTLEAASSNHSRWMALSAVLILLSALLRAAVGGSESPSDN